VTPAESVILVALRKASRWTYDVEAAKMPRSSSAHGPKILFAVMVPVDERWDLSTCETLDVRSNIAIRSSADLMFSRKTSIASSA